MTDCSNNEASIDCDDRVVAFIDQLQTERVEALGAHCGGGHKDSDIT